MTVQATECSLSPTSGVAVAMTYQRLYNQKRTRNNGYTADWFRPWIRQLLRPWLFLARILPTQISSPYDVAFTRHRCSATSCSVCDQIGSRLYESVSLCESVIVIGLVDHVEQLCVSPVLCSWNARRTGTRFF